MPATYNRAAAFVEYCKGTDLQEISHALAIPYDHLKRWEREERWAVLVPKMEIVPARGENANDKDEAERATEKIKANRARNLEIFYKLQEDLLDVVAKLRSGELKSRRVFANGFSVEVEPTLRDRCDLALYAKNVAEASYRALGDVESAKNAPAADRLPNAGQIIIHLPAPIAAPREIRALGIDSEVVLLDRPAIADPGNGSPIPSSS